MSGAVRRLMSCSIGWWRRSTVVTVPAADLRDALEAARLVDKIVEDHNCMTLPKAVEAYRNRRNAYAKAPTSTTPAPTATDDSGNRNASSRQPASPTLGITLRPSVHADAFAIA